MVASRTGSQRGSDAQQKLAETKSMPVFNVGGQLDFARNVYAEIAARVLRDTRDVRQAASDVMTGFLGRLLARGATHPGIHIEERGDEIVFHLEVVARHGASFYDLGLEIQRRVAERVRHMTGRASVVNVNVRGVSL